MNLETRIEKLKALLDNFKDDERLPQIKELISEYGTERICKAPFAHKTDDYVAVYDGGWIDFVSFFVVNAVEYMRFLKEENCPYTEEELFNSIFFGSLYKLGHPNNKPMYTPQENKWRRDILGELYLYNSIYSGLDPAQINTKILNDYSIKLNNFEHEAVYNINAFLSVGGVLKILRGTFDSSIVFVLTVAYLKTVNDLRNIKPEYD